MTTTTPTPPGADEPVMRGNVEFYGKDALLFAAILARRTTDATKNAKSTEIMREAVRCYAEKLNITV